MVSRDIVKCAYRQEAQEGIAVKQLLGTRISWPGAFFLASALALAGSARGEVALGSYTYTIVFDGMGEVGEYTNRVRRDGDAIVVENRTRIAVKFLAAILFRLTADSTSVWRNGRMVRYRSVTDDNGRAFAVTGRASGGKFVVEGSEGKFVGPPDAFPHNPWSMALLRAGTIMSPKTGRFYPARVSAGRPETVDIGGHSLKVRSYRIDSDRKSWVWYDSAGIAVKFVMDRKHGRGTVTFILDRSR